MSKEVLKKRQEADIKANWEIRTEHLRDCYSATEDIGMILYLFSGLIAVWRYSISLRIEVEVRILNILNTARLLEEEGTG